MLQKLFLLGACNSTYTIASCVTHVICSSVMSHMQSPSNIHPKSYCGKLHTENLNRTSRFLFLLESVSASGYQAASSSWWSILHNSRFIDSCSVPNKISITHPRSQSQHRYPFAPLAEPPPEAIPLHRPPTNQKTSSSLSYPSSTPPPSSSPYSFPAPPFPPFIPSTRSKISSSQ